MKKILKLMNVAATQAATVAATQAATTAAPAVGNKETR